jgi:hypothetical protein
MSLRYALFNNPFSPGTDELTARVMNIETVEFSEIMKMLTRRGLTTTDTETESVIKELVYTINELISSGKAVNTPIANFRPSIKGIFLHPDERYDPQKHKVHLNCTPGKDIEIDDRHLEFEKIRPETAKPLVDLFVDYTTRTENSLITPGSTAEIKGELLKIDADDVLQGVFFIAGDDTETRADAYLHNKPSHLIFNVPASLPAGEYRVEVRNKVNRSNLIQRETLNQKLSVA